MNKNTFNKNILYLSGLLIIVLLIPYYFGFLDIKNKSEHFSALQSGYSNELKRQQQIDLIQKMVNDSNSSISIIDSSIVSSDGDVAFIEQIENIAKQNGLDIQINTLSIDTDKSLDGSNLNFLHVNANIKGDWAGMYSFITQIESLPFKIKIDNFAMITSGSSDLSTGANKNGSKNTWQGAFQIRVLKYKDALKK